MRNFKLELQNINDQISLLVNQKRKIEKEFMVECEHVEIYRGAAGWYVCLNCNKRFSHKEILFENLLSNVVKKVNWKKEFEKKQRIKNNV